MPELWSNDMLHIKCPMPPLSLTSAALLSKCEFNSYTIFNAEIYYNVFLIYIFFFFFVFIHHFIINIDFTRVSLNTRRKSDHTQRILRKHNIFFCSFFY